MVKFLSTNSNMYEKQAHSLTRYRNLIQEDCCLRFVIIEVKQASHTAAADQQEKQVAWQYIGGFAGLRSFRRERQFHPTGFDVVLTLEHLSFKLIGVQSLNIRRLSRIWYQKYQNSTH